MTTGNEERMRLVNKLDFETLEVIRNTIFALAHT